jgi:hypothetical protein
VTAAFPALFSNPEVKRNIRAQLRPNRMIVTATVCGIISLFIVPSLAVSFDHNTPRGQSGDWYLRAMLFLQAATLLFGGCGACLNAISREKEMNTFDYQRITRMSPLELALGKLLGAPAWAMFATLCFLPATLMAAISAETTLADLLSAYTVIIFGSLMFMSFALLLSLLVDRTAAGLKWTFLILVFSFGLLPGGILSQAGPLNPMAAFLLVGKPPHYPPVRDVFFGVIIPHPIVVVVLSLSYSAWFLLALSRNIKRDPSVYELYTPAQALVFAFFVTFLQVGFFPWGKLDPNLSQIYLLGLNTMLFYVLGVVLLRSRDRSRRLLRKTNSSQPGPMESIWPAPYLLAGMLPVGVLVISLIEITRKSGEPLDGVMALFRLILLAAWVVRDILYLQWMYIRGSRHSLRTAFLLLIVFYVAFNTVLGVGYRSQLAERVIFTPPLALSLDVATWNKSGGILLTALFVQIAACALFATLQHRALVHLAAPLRSQPQAGPGPATSVVG